MRHALSLVASIGVLAMACAGGNGSTVPSDIVATVSVDLSAPVPTKSLSGLLHGFNIAGQPPPPSMLYTALKPAIWRSAPWDVPPSIPIGIGARYEFVLSDMWGYPSPSGSWPYGAPWVATAEFTQKMREQAQSLRGVPGVVWEPWNEPNPLNQEFWNGTETQFFDTYALVYRVLREELGSSALVAGPSLSVYDSAYMRRFADYCLANACEANVLTWHELGGDRPLSKIADRLRVARRDFLDDPKYAPLRIKEIHINEYDGPSETHNPAASLTYLFQLEAGGADAAARACWSDGNGGSECRNNALGGLVTPDKGEPRSVWWAYKAYADGVQSRVRSVVSDSRMFAFGSRAGATGTEAQALVGISAIQNGTVPASTALAVRFLAVSSVSFLRGHGRVRAEVLEIPDTETAPLSAPTLVVSTDVAVINDSVAVPVLQARANAVYIVTLERIP